MIHGHSTIELTNVNTGEVERYEDDNLVTNGLQYYSRFNAIPEDFWKNLLSGIKLFGSQLEESVETLSAPIGTELVGYAGMNADTADAKRGLLNQEQSSVLEDMSGVRLVWDFAQSQANGTIACIGITPNKYVNEIDNPPAEYSYSGSINLEAGAYSDLIDYDMRTGIAITFSSDEVNNRLRIVKSYARFFYVSILNEEPYYKILEDFYVDIPGLSSGSSGAIFIGSDESYYYFISTKSHKIDVTPYVSTFSLIKLKKGTFDVSVEEVQFSDNAYPDDYFPSNNTAQLESSFLFGDFIYLHNNRNHALYKFKLSDFSFVKKFDSTALQNALSSKSPVLVRSDGVLLNGVSMDGQDNLYEDKWLNVRKTSNKSSDREKHFFPVLNGTYALLCTGEYIYSYQKTFLFTVNNLSTPVTKTADKTMKVTYVLKEVYPESEEPQ